MLPVFADASNNNTQALVTCMLCQKKLNTCINKILIYNRKWFRPFISSQTSSKHHNYQATMCVLCLQWRHLFSAVERIWQGRSKSLQKVYTSIFQVFKLLFMWKLISTLSTNRFFLIHTKYASIRSSCIYEDVNYPFENDLYILKKN